jgi:hypothetical protein
MFKNILKYYMLNTMFGIPFVIFLVLVTGIPMTTDDFYEFIFVGWLLGWFIRKVFGGVFLGMTNAKSDLEDLIKKED